MCSLNSKAKQPDKEFEVRRFSLVRHCCPARTHRPGIVPARRGCSDLPRRQYAHIPEQVAFATKPELAKRMVQRVQVAGLPICWVVADTVYSHSTDLRCWLEEQDVAYVMGVPSIETVCVQTRTGLLLSTVASIPQHSHPHDGRKKGISDQQLLLLASQHHRHIPAFSQEPPAPPVCKVPTLPDALLALPEQITVLQAQIAALQQQMADLTHLFTRQVLVSTINTSSPLPKSPKANKLLLQPTPARAACEASARHRTRRVWRTRELCGHLPKAWRAAV